jgi:septum formation protein
MSDLIEPVARIHAPPIVLASASPRRRELLALLGWEFVVDVADVDETPLPDEAPGPMVERLARTKAAAVALRRPDAIVIGADTTVDLAGLSLGKLVDREDGRTMLRSIAGRTHVVHTGVCVVRGAEVTSFIDSAVVTMAPMSDADIDWYLDSGEPEGKAGAYAIQGIGGTFVEHVDGNVHTVIGLPVARLRPFL